MANIVGCGYMICFRRFTSDGFWVQAERDVADGVSRAVIPPPGSEQASIGEAVIAVVAAQMDADRKTTALKALQVGCLFCSGGCHRCCCAKMSIGRSLWTAVLLLLSN